MGRELHPTADRIPPLLRCVCEGSQFWTLVCAYVITSNLITFWQYRGSGLGLPPARPPAPRVLRSSPPSFLSTGQWGLSKEHNWRTLHAGTEIILLLTLDSVDQLRTEIWDVGKWSGSWFSLYSYIRGFRRNVSQMLEKTSLMTIILWLTFFIYLWALNPVFCSCLTHIFNVFRGHLFGVYLSKVGPVFQSFFYPIQTLFLSPERTLVLCKVAGKKKRLREDGENCKK